MWLTFSWSGDLQKEEWIFVRATRSLSSGARSLRFSSVNSKNTSPYSLHSVWLHGPRLLHILCSLGSRTTLQRCSFLGLLFLRTVMTQKPWQYLCYVNMLICQPLLCLRFRTTPLRMRIIARTSCERVDIIWSVSFQGGDLHLESVYHFSYSFSKFPRTILLVCSSYLLCYTLLLLLPHA